MGAKSEFRYDPLYRVMKNREELQQMEGAFNNLFQRLKGISNLGLIPEVFEMARYSKYEHAIGTVHQVCSTVDMEVVGEQYCPPLIIAALFKHLGHYPHTYSSENALLLSTHLGEDRSVNKAKDYVIRKVERVFDASAIEADRADDIKDDLLSLKAPFLLYRFMSADLLVKHWSSVRKRIEDLNCEDLSTTIENLVDRKSDGFKYLNLADKVDFVQRDAFYFGAVRLEIAPQHLYDQFRPNSVGNRINEKVLLDMNHDYLSEHYYNAPDVELFETLYEKVLASLILSKNFEFKWLEYDDSSFTRLITEGIDSNNNRVGLPKLWLSRMSDLFDGGHESWHLLARLREIPFPDEDNPVDVEYRALSLSRSLRGLLKYPFDRGVLLTVDYHNEDPDRYDISFFCDTAAQNYLKNMLCIMRNIRKRTSHVHLTELKKSLAEILSWTGSVRFDNHEVINSLAEALSNQGDDHVKEVARSFCESIMKIRSYRHIWNHYEALNFLMVYHLESESEDDMAFVKAFLRTLVNLPVKLLQFKTIKEHLARVRSSLNEMLIDPDREVDKKGNIFEALCLVDRLAEAKGAFQCFFNGMVVRDDKNDTDEHEFDIVELRLDQDDELHCYIYACSISNDYREKNDEALDKLVENLSEKFPDMTVHSRYLIPTNRNNNEWAPDVVSTRFNYEPQI